MRYKGTVAATCAAGRCPTPEVARSFVMMCFYGGFTSRLSFSLQTLDLRRAGALGRAAVNVAASLALCPAFMAWRSANSSPRR